MRVTACFCRFVIEMMTILLIVINSTLYLYRFVLNYTSMFQRLYIYTAENMRKCCMNINHADFKLCVLMNPKKVRVMTPSNLIRRCGSLRFLFKSQ